MGTVNRADGTSCQQWLITEIDGLNGRRTLHLISSQDLFDGQGELHTGKTILVRIGNKTIRKGNVVIASDDKKFLETELKHLKETHRKVKVELMDQHKPQAHSNHQIESPEMASDEDGDFQVTESEWDPDTNADTESENENDTKRRKLSKLVKKEINKITNRAPNQKVRSPSVVNGHPPVTIREQYSQSLLSTTRKLSEHVRKSPGITYNRVLTPECGTMDMQNKSDEKKSSVSKKMLKSKGDVPPMTFDQQTQTPNDSEKDSIIKLRQDVEVEFFRLNKTLHDMKMEIFEKIEIGLQLMQQKATDSSYGQSPTNYANDTPITSTTKNRQGTKRPRFNNSVLLEMNDASIHMETHDEKTSAKNGSFYGLSTSHNGYEQNVQEAQPIFHSDFEESSGDMVSIGSGKTYVPKHIYKQIDWNSHTIATRKLLMALFPRRTLATHSLTGKSSPAFTHKPAKMCLDPRKVSDIVMTVSERCGVRESQVRSAITTKCADENKMYKMRTSKNKKHKKMRARSSDSNQENECPKESKPNISHEISLNTTPPATLPPILYGKEVSISFNE